MLFYKNILTLSILAVISVPSFAAESENVEKLLYCSFCMTVAYCSVNCQRYFSIYDSKITIRIILSFIIEIIGNYIRYHVRKQFIQEVLD
jgi:hypothetical protein